jgi:hypothetical protein
VNTCIGWIDDEPCPSFGGPYHGCRRTEGHKGAHQCHCGASVPWRYELKVPHERNPR